MRLTWLAIVVLSVVAGCGKPPEGPAGAPKPASAGDAPPFVAGAASTGAHSARQGDETSAAPSNDAASAGETPAAPEPEPGSSVELSNVSYDPTRELWKEINEVFAADYLQEKNVTVTINQSHAGSSSQARAVIDGNGADVVSLAMFTDTDAIRKKGLIRAGWSSGLPNNSLPYWSTIVFVVRKGNPKNIHDWPDLVKEGVEVITPSPKTSGNGKLSFLGAWGWAIQSGKSAKQAEEFVTKVYQHVPVLDPAARAASTTFTRKGMGDVHLTWENEAYLEMKENEGQFEVVYPSVSIKAEPCVAVVDANVDRKGTRAVAEAYLKYLYTPKAQEIIARNHYRPYGDAVGAKFPKIKVFTIKEIAASWDEADKKFFAQDAMFDKIFATRR